VGRCSRSWSSGCRKRGGLIKLAVCVVAGVDSGTSAGVEGSIKRGAVTELGGRWSGSAGGEDMPELAEEM
jgi:hypothetical protein